MIIDFFLHSVETGELLEGPPTFKEFGSIAA
jgi:hypothetical protein